MSGLLDCRFAQAAPLAAGAMHSIAVLAQTASGSPAQVRCPKPMKSIRRLPKTAWPYRCDSVLSISTRVDCGHAARMPPRVLSRAELFAAGCPTYANLPTHQGDIPLHQHDFIELALVRDGRAVHRTIHGLQPIAQGDAFVILPGQWHCYERCRDLRLGNCAFGTDVLHRQLAWATGDPALATLLSARGQGIATVHLGEPDRLRCLAQVEAISALVHGRAPLATATEQLGHLLVLLGTLARQAMPPASNRATDPGHPAVAQAMALIEADLGHNWGLDELARRCDLDRSYLVRRFRRHAGFTPINWLARRRCEVAAVRLLTTDRSVAAIAAAVGWNQNHFARRFRALFGQSPTAYRKQLPIPAITTATVDDWIQA